MEKYKFNNLNKLLGGAKCPTTGYRQHSGECLHDSISTILTFGNIIADNIQGIFDMYHDSKSLIDYLRNQARINHKSHRIYLPFFIDDTVLDQFIEIGLEYIKSLYIRYINQQFYDAEYPADIDVEYPADINKENIDPVLDLELPIRHGRLERLESITDNSGNRSTRYLERQDSYFQSIVCTKTLNDIENLNKINKSEFKIDKHGGSYTLDYIIICILNYFFANNTYLYLNYINLLNICFVKIKILVLD